jgi:hypothetical protein
VSLEEEVITVLQRSCLWGSDVLIRMFLKKNFMREMKRVSSRSQDNGNGFSVFVQ